MLYADAGVDIRGEDGGVEAGKKIGADYGANRYHKPADEYDASWRLDGIAETTEILFDVGDLLAQSEEWPNWYEGNEFRSLRDAMSEE
jgi:Zn-dependent M28 family amino/carboxypeptidase